MPEQEHTLAALLVSPSSGDIFVALNPNLSTFHTIILRFSSSFELLASRKLDHSFLFIIIKDMSLDDSGGALLVVGSLFLNTAYQFGLVGEMNLSLSFNWCAYYNQTQP